MTEQSQMSTLFLSWMLAKTDKRNTTVAIRKTARKLMNRTKHQKVFDMCKVLLKCPEVNIEPAMQAGYAAYLKEVKK